jgi:MFS family permease
LPPAALAGPRPPERRKDAMRLSLILLVQVFNHTCFRGSKVLMTLFALELGATPVTAGILFSMYSLLPTFLSVFVGRLSDRIGYRAPMLFGTGGMLAGMLVPWFVPGLTALFFSATIVGTSYIFYTVSVQSLVGSLGGGLARTRNYSLYTLCVGFTALFGPVIAGFSIEHLGGAATYLVMAALTVVPIATLVLGARQFPNAVRAASAGAKHGAFDLLRNPGLRRILLVAGLVETGNELGNFLIPVYGSHVGLPPSQIGLVMGALAGALLLVRALMPALVARAGEARVLAGSLAVAAGACILFPFAETFAPLAAVAFLMGLGIGGGAPLSMMLVYNRSPEGRCGEAMGLRQTVNKGTEVAVPVVFGSVSTAFGMLPVFWLVGIMLGFGALLMRREAGRAEDPITT